MHVTRQIGGLTPVCYNACLVALAGPVNCLWNRERLADRRAAQTTVDYMKMR